MSDLEQEPRSRLRQIGWVIGSLLVLALLGWGVWKLANGKKEPPRKTVAQVTQLQLIKPPPPPPPPPPPKQKIEEQEKPQPEFKTVTPDNRPPEPKAEAPPGPPALDAQGDGPGDAFGLEGRPGGSEFGGGGGGGGGTAWGWYATLLQQRVQESVQKQRRFKGQRFTATLQIWLGADGTPTRVELLKSSGKPEIDQALRESVSQMARPPELPPKDLPQPALVRVASQ